MDTEQRERERERELNSNQFWLKLQIEFLNAQLKTNVEKSPSPCLKVTSSKVCYPNSLLLSHPGNLLNHLPNPDTLARSLLNGARQHLPGAQRLHAGPRRLLHGARWPHGGVRQPRLLDRSIKISRHSTTGGKNVALCCHLQKHEATK